MRHLQNTYIINDPEPNQIADAIIDILSKERLQEDIRQAGFETVKKHFCYHNNMKKTEQLMYEI